MRQRQVIVCETGGQIAETLRPAAQAGGWRLREVRHPRVCLGMLPQGGESILVLRVGRDLTREFTLLDQAARLFPETALIVACESENPAIVDLAWDLGARFVLAPAQAREFLPVVVAGLLSTSALEPER